MRKILLLVAIFSMMAFVACSGNKEKKEESNNKEQTEVLEAETVYQLMLNAEKNVGKEVYVQGMVSHVCQHSGRRCFLVDSTEEVSVRVETGGQIKSFDKELSGTMIAVKGKLQEKQLTNEYIDEFEAKVKAEKDTEEGGEHCNSQMANILKMRTWMKEHNKNYYPIYSIAGESYEILE